MKTIKNPYTNKELFNIITDQLKKQGLLPAILDYSLDEAIEAPIRSYFWNPVGTVDFGSSEGIYLEIYAEGDFGNGHQDRIHLGTYKTLFGDKAAFKTMGDLNADFVFACRDFIASNFDNFDWNGYYVRFFAGEKVLYTARCKSLAEARGRLSYEATNPVNKGITSARLYVNDECLYAEFDGFLWSEEEFINALMDADNAKKEEFLGYPLSDIIVETLDERIREHLAHLSDAELGMWKLRLWKPDWKDDVIE